MQANDPCATFEHKWTTAHPEFGLALRFVPAPSRRAAAAFACIGFEIEHAAFRLREGQVAAGKLEWWLQELLAMHAGAPRHPLTQALSENAAVGALPRSSWTQLAAGALAQRQSATASSTDDMLATTLTLYQPLAEIARCLFNDSAVEEASTARALSRAFRDAATLEQRLAEGHLALPLDLLAKHQLARDGLAAPSAPRTAALREFFNDLAGRMSRIDRNDLSTLDATGLAAERSRCTRAGRAAEPSRAATEAFSRLPISALWTAWRCARRQRVEAPA